MAEVATQSGVLSLVYREHVPISNMYHCPQDDSTHLGRQFMEHEDARDRVLALVQQGNSILGVAHHKAGSRPTSQI